VGIVLSDPFERVEAAVADGGLRRAELLDCFEV
jgi:hypothetical protein